MTVRHAALNDVEKLSLALTAAFRNDPVHVWFFPDEKQRAHRHPKFFRAVLRYGIRHGIVLAAEEDGGAALWEPPRRQRDTWLPKLELALRTAPALGWRALTVGRAMARFPELHPAEPHWYLAVIGIDPSAQGKGAGAALIKPILARCDTEQLPAYLEASRRENVPYYERFGFEVVAPLHIAGGPTIWRMTRPPRPIRS